MNTIFTIKIDFDSEKLSDETNEQFEKRRKEFDDKYYETLADKLEVFANEEVLKLTGKSEYKASISHWII